MNLTEIFRNKVRAKLRADGIQAIDLAKILGESSASVSQYIGKNATKSPGLEVITKYAKALGMEPLELLSDGLKVERKEHTPQEAIKVLGSALSFPNATLAQLAFPGMLPSTVRLLDSIGDAKGWHLVDSALQELAREILVRTLESERKSKASEPDKIEPDRRKRRL